MLNFTSSLLQYDGFLRCCLSVHSSDKVHKINTWCWKSCLFMCMCLLHNFSSHCVETWYWVCARSIVLFWFMQVQYNPQFTWDSVCTLHFTFRCIHCHVKHLLPLACLSICISTAPTGWSSMTIVIEDFSKIWENPNFVKMGQNIRHVTRRLKYVLLLLATLHYHKCTVWVNWYQAVKLAREVINIIKTHHNVFFLYVHCISSSKTTTV